MTDEGVRAAGGVLWRRTGDALEVLLVHRDRYDDWTFPKGKLDPGEGWLAAAEREVLEETGFVVEVGDELAETRYVDGHGADKRVRYWAMIVRGGEFVANDEVDAMAWVRQGDARGRLSYRRDVAVLDSLLDGVADP